MIVLKQNLYFDDYLKQFEGYLDATVEEFKDWEDETVELLLQRKGIDLSPLDECKFKAYRNFDAKTCYISTPLEFCNLASVLNDEIPSTSTLETIDPAYVAWALNVLEYFDSNNEIELTEEVIGYIKACFYDAGMTKLPEALSIFETKTKSDLPDDNVTSDHTRIRTYVAAKSKLAGFLST